MSRALHANVTRARIIAALTEANGAAMTEADLAAACRRAPGTIHKHLHVLRSEGSVSWDPPRKRTARIAPGDDQRSHMSGATNTEARMLTTRQCACMAAADLGRGRACEALHGEVEVKIRFDIAILSAASESAEAGA